MGKRNKAINMKNWAQQKIDLSDVKGSLQVDNQLWIVSLFFRDDTEILIAAICVRGSDVPVAPD